jgi:hypothetical protein
MPLHIHAREQEMLATSQRSCLESESRGAVGNGAHCMRLDVGASAGWFGSIAHAAMTPKIVSRRGAMFLDIAANITTPFTRSAHFCAASQERGAGSATP